MTWLSTSSAEAPLSSVRTLTAGTFDGGEAVHPETGVGGGADHGEGEHEHGREHRPADAGLGELLHCLGLDRQRLPAGQVAGLPDHRSAVRDAGHDLHLVAQAAPGCHPYFHGASLGTSRTDRAGWR